LLSYRRGLAKLASPTRHDEDCSVPEEQKRWVCTFRGYVSKLPQNKAQASLRRILHREKLLGHQLAPNRIDRKTQALERRGS